MAQADLIITNANIITMDPQNPRAEAVAVTDGLISAVGSSAEVAGLLGDATEVVDFEGGTLCAGFVEPHSHVLLMAMLLAPQVSDCRSFNCPTWQDIEAVISERVAQTPAGEPILIYGLDPIVHDHPMPSRDELDAFTTSHPLVVIALSAHTISANTAAFEFAGITAETPDPPGGRFGKAADGSLDGVVHEATAVAMTAGPLLAAADFDLVASLRDQAADLSRAGFTTVGELLVQDHDMPVMAALQAAGDLPIRLRWYEGTNHTLKPTGSAGDTDPMVRQVGLKLWVDGSPLEGKILSSEPFLDTKVTRDMGLTAPCCGSANYTEEELLTIVRAYADSGLQFACHVQGDAATDRILNVYETVLRERNMIGTDHRWRLEHCGETTKAQFERANSLGVTCSMFVRHVYYFGDTYVDDILGEDRGSHWMRLRSAIDSGISISLHHDGYFTPPVPIGNLETATTRVSKSGRKLGTDECIAIDEALNAITINAAWHLFSDTEVGSIEVGKFADFTELSADPYTVEPSDLEATVRVLGTWINGTRVDPS
ncbi:MAG: amidohydrolase [Candidatus Nanopelagicales bacterium]|jgi:predicted amidohydrolase YtcJ